MEKTLSTTRAWQNGTHKVSHNSDEPEYFTVNLFAGDDHLSVDREEIQALLDVLTAALKDTAPPKRGKKR